jgi:hypothetical protein
MKILIVISAFILCLDLSAQKEQIPTCRWVDNSSGSVLPSASDYVSARKGAFLYSFSNDENNLYVDIKVTESIEEGKVLQMGMILWLNTDGKSRKVTGVRYPIGSKFSRSRRGEPMGTITQETPLSLATTIELIGFKDINPSRFPANNSDNFRGSVKYDNDGNLLYSMTIPLAKLPAAGKSAQGKKTLLNIGIEYGAPPQMQNQGGPRPGGSGEAPSGGGGGRRGGGGGAGTRGAGAAPGPGFAGNDDAPKPVLIWVKNLALAEKK